MEQTNFFQCLSDETRLRIVMLFAVEEELCVCEMSHALDLAQPKISRHMATMRENGIVTSRRQAQWVFYRLSDQLFDWQRETITATIKGNSHEGFAQKDKHRLRMMLDRPERCT